MRLLLLACGLVQLSGAVSLDLARVILHSTDAQIGAVGNDASGNIYVSGRLQGGEFQAVRSLQGDGGLFLIKLSSSGETIYATRIGTHLYMDSFGGMAVGREGTVWIAGSSRAPDLPVTPGGAPIRDADLGDAFVIAVTPSGDRIATATYFGGSGLDTAGGIALAPEGGVWVAGRTSSRDFPLTPGALRWDYDEADGFLARLRPDGSVAYSTRVGTSDWDEVAAVTTGLDGAPVLLVRTSSAEFPGVIGLGIPAQSTCVVKLLRDASAFRFSYCFPPNAYGTSITAAGSGVWASGSLYSIGLPVTGDAAQKQPGARSYYHLGQRGDGPPAPIVRRLVTAPGKLYAATDLGLYISEDSGESWRASATALPSISTIAIAASDPAVMYLAPESEAQVYRSRDAGETWEPAGRWAPTTFIRALAVDPRDPMRVFAAGIGVYRSIDGGETWESGEWPSPAGVVRLLVDGTNPDILYAGTYLHNPIRFVREGGVFRSTDGGRTFVPTSVRNADALALALDPSQPGTIYAGGSQHFARSDDYGQTWTVKPPVQAGYPWGFRGLAPDLAQPGTLYGVVGEGLVFRTRDGGDTWEGVDGRKRFGAAEDIVVTTDGTVHLAGAIGADAFLVRLAGDTGELRYATYFGGMSTEQVQSIAADAAGNVVIAGHTWSSDLPVKDGPVMEFASNWTLAGFVAGFSAEGSLRFSTLTAANAILNGVTVLDTGLIVAAGMTDAPEFPLTAQPLPGYPKRGFLIGLR